MLQSEHAHASGDGGLGAIIGRHHQVPKALPLRRDGDREGTSHRPQRAIQRQFADEEVILGQRDDAHRSQDPQRHRQVEARAFLAHVGRSQVDRDRLVGVAEA